jgi:hypothetical protein
MPKSFLFQKLNLHVFDFYDQIIVMLEIECLESWMIDKSKEVGQLNTQN